MKVFLVRHGETVTSGKSYAGRLDVPLNEAGKLQAQSLAADLAEQSITKIISSPLSRAMDTAKPLADARGLRTIQLPDLMEFDFGHFEGQSKAALALKLRKAHAERKVPGGESLRDAWVRAGRVQQRLASFAERQNGVCVIIGHFWINRFVWGRLSGLEFNEACRSRDYRPKTGSIIQIAPPVHMAVQRRGACRYS